MMVTDSNPLGLGSFVPITKGALGLEGQFKGAFNYGVAGQATYNSNFFETENNEESEISGAFTPWIHYTSDPEGGATFSLTANYMPSFRTYMENSDLNGTDQSMDLNLSFRKGRTQIDAFGRYAQVSGTDRLTGEFVQGSVMTTGFRANRQVGTRTSLHASWSYGKSEFDSSDSVGAEIYTSDIGTYWEATERLSFGPTLRYTVSKSDNIGTREAWALMMAVQYRVGERILLSAAVGPEYSTSSESSESSLGVAGNLSASYIINERWSWKSTIDTAAVPSPNQKNFVINNVAITTGLQRQLLRGSLSGGLVVNSSKYEDVGTGNTSGSDELNLSVFMSYGRPLFSDRVGFNTEVRYTQNDGDRDWSQVQVSAGLSVSF